MLRTIKKYFLTIAAGTLLLTPLLAPAVASAGTPDVQSNLCQGANLTVGAPDNCTGTTAQDPVNNLLAAIINGFSIVVGVVSVIMIIIGGLKYITSGGDSGNITGAKNTILYAIIGLVVVAIAQFVVRFVLGKVSNLGTTG